MGVPSIPSLDRELKARVGVPVERARTLPGRWYADPDHYALEIERVQRLIDV